MLLVFYSGKLFSQEQEGRFFFSRSISLDFDKLQVKEANNTPDWEQLHAAPMWQHGLHHTWLLSARIKKRWLVSTGAIFYQFSWLEKVHYDSYDKYGHFIDSHNYTERHRFDYPGIPLTLSYRIPMNKSISILAECGLVYFSEYRSPDFMLGTREAIGWQYAKEYVAFAIKANGFYSSTPYLRYAFSNHTVKLYSIGIELSLRITLGKLKPVSK
jgi:hypothetical protein